MSVLEVWIMLIAIIILFDMALEIWIGLYENRKRKKWEEQGKRYIVIEHTTWRWWR